MDKGVCISKCKERNTSLYSNGFYKEKIQDSIEIIFDEKQTGANVMP